MTTPKSQNPEGKVVACGECGMPCTPNEYHPYAACLMFKACHDSKVVRANLTNPNAMQRRLEALADEMATTEKVMGQSYWAKQLRAVLRGDGKGEGVSTAEGEG